MIRNHFGQIFNEDSGPGVTCDLRSVDACCTPFALNCIQHQHALIDEERSSMGRGNCYQKNIGSLPIFLAITVIVSVHYLYSLAEPLSPCCVTPDILERAPKMNRSNLIFKHMATSILYPSWGFVIVGDHANFSINVSYIHTRQNQTLALGNFSIEIHHFHNVFI